MPYLIEKLKAVMNLDPRPLTAGELNYCITMLCKRYLKHQAYKGGHYDYERINNIIGVLECAKIEFYRRIAVPYEDKKIKENGDVY
jgi:hypothetical protein